MKVAAVMGSESDKEVVQKAVTLLEKYGVEVEWRIISAHRTPKLAHDFASSLKDNGYEVCIACAGKAAHLAGVIAGITTIPVIGLPIKSSTMDGLDSLLSVVQMPSGVPVATVAINGAENAAILALQILGIKYPEISDKLIEFKKEMNEKIIKIDSKLRAERGQI